MKNRQPAIKTEASPAAGELLMRLEIAKKQKSI